MAKSKNDRRAPRVRTMVMELELVESANYGEELIVTEFGYGGPAKRVRIKLSRYGMEELVSAAEKALKERRRHANSLASYLRIAMEVQP